MLLCSFKLKYILNGFTWKEAEILANFKQLWPFSVHFCAFAWRQHSVRIEAHWHTDDSGLATNQPHSGGCNRGKPPFPHCTLLSLWLNPLAGCIFLWQHQMSWCPFSSSSPTFFLCLSSLVLWPCRICFGNPCLLHSLRNYLRVLSRHNTVCHRGENVLIPHWIGSGFSAMLQGYFEIKGARSFKHQNAWYIWQMLSCGVVLKNCGESLFIQDFSPANFIDDQKGEEYSVLSFIYTINAKL